MKLNENLIAVLEMMMDRIKDRDDGSFAIPGDLAPRDELSETELDALERAGFVWIDEMYDDDRGGWLLDFHKDEKNEP